MKNYKILLVSFWNDESIGLRIIHSILIKEGYAAKILFLKLHNTKKEITEREKELFYTFLKEYAPDLLAFSLVSPNFMLYKSMYSKIRNTIGKYCKILIGGWQASLNPEETIKYADYLCIGEGEEAIQELVWNLSHASIPHDISNIWVNRKGCIIDLIKNGVKVLNKNLDEYPIPLFDNQYSYYIENNELVNVDPYFLNDRYGIMMSRGCPYSCTYCSNSYMKNIYSDWSKLRYRSKEHIIKELKQVKKALPNIKRINFYDEVFHIENRKNFLKQYKEEINLPFYCMFYPGMGHEELLKDLKEAGLVGVWLGIQSGSKRIREKIYKRYYTNDQVLKQANLFKKYNINVKYDFIFNSPFENFFDRRATIQLMKKLPKPKSFNFFSLKFFPNTEITKMALKKKLMTQEQVDDQLSIIYPEYEISENKKQTILNSIK
jgi:radical SAM superfamily enzyme YgiQ (UPF0313 family)